MDAGQLVAWTPLCLMDAVSCGPSEARSHKRTTAVRETGRPFVIVASNLDSFGILMATRCLSVHASEQNVPDHVAGRKR